MVVLSRVPALLCDNTPGRAVLPRPKPHRAVCHVTGLCAERWQSPRKMWVPSQWCWGVPGSGCLVLQMLQCFFPLETQALCSGLPGLLQTDVKAGPGARE